jgi:AcrR family transcriptional regulator
MKKKAAAKFGGRRKAFCEEQALNAALRVFGEKGYDATSLTDLTEAMGINKPSLYSTFGNKEQLFRKAMERFSQAGESHLASCLAEPTAKGGVTRLLQEGVAMFTDPNASGACFVTQGPPTDPETTDETRKFVAQKRAVPEKLLRLRFDKAVKDGELPKGTSTKNLARFYSVMIQGIALQAQHGGTKEELLSVVDVAMSKWPTP